MRATMSGRCVHLRDGDARKAQIWLSKMPLGVALL